MRPPVFLVGAADAAIEPLLAALAAGSGVWRAAPGWLDAMVAVGGRRRLEAADAEELADAREALRAALTDREGRFAEAAPGDAVPVAGEAALAGRVPFLAALFPEARFVYVAGEPDGRGWAGATERLLDDLEALAPERWCVVEHGALLAAPRAELQRLCGFLGLRYDQALLTPVEAARAARRVRDLVAAEAPGEPPPPGDPFRSVSTASVAGRLHELGGSLLITTYQSNRLVVARADDGRLNTHFRTFDKPMGVAVTRGRIALGTRTEVWDLRDVPAVAPKLAPRGRHDAAFLPRSRHITGDVAVHDLAFAGGELWLVATSFSCLATLDGDHSFVPRWAPSFITAVAPGDRCHLNGLAVVDGAVRFVTALGRSDVPGGWRARKADGGLLLDVRSSEEVAGGLCMPHSPRWHDGRLWLLESGRGALCVVDPATGAVETVAELPGFTRGLAFAGRTAFVGLSQVRESAVFGDLPVTERLAERACGAWMVDIATGAVTGFLRFDDAVQEVFDVAFLPGLRWPEVAEPGADAVASSYVLP